MCSFFLENDIAEDKVMVDQVLLDQSTCIYLGESKISNVYPACSVTRAMIRKVLHLILTSMRDRNLAYSLYQILEINLFHNKYSI